MRNVPKLMQNQFSDFLKIFSFNKIFVISFWYRDFRQKVATINSVFLDIDEHFFGYFSEGTKKMKKKCRQIVSENLFS